MAERIILRKVTGDAVSQMLPGELGYNDAANQLVLAGFFGTPVVVTGGVPQETTIVPQATPSALWSITHNLHRFPAVAIVDSSGRLVEGDVTYITANQLTVAFTAAFSGTAYLN